MRAQSTMEFVMAFSFMMIIFTLVGYLLNVFIIDTDRPDKILGDYLLDDFQGKIEYAKQSMMDISINFTFPPDINDQRYIIGFQSYPLDKRSFISITTNVTNKDRYRYLPLAENTTPIYPGDTVRIIKNSTGVFIT